VAPMKHPLSLKEMARIILCLTLWTASAGLVAEASRIPDAGVTDKRGSRIDLNLRFTDEAGKSRQLREFFDGRRPVVLAPSYYKCPRLCTLVYNGLRDSVAGGMSLLKPGRDYQIVSFSINPEERPEIAAKKGEAYRSTLEGVDAAAWPFLTADQATITALTDSVGYRFKKDGNDYSHAAALIILMPDGTISRYLYGVEFRPADLRWSLIEASSGRIGSPADTIMMFCFRFDDTKGQYTPHAWTFMRIASGLVVFTLACLIFFLRLKPRNQ
jgi:protein SCO1/2